MTEGLSGMLGLDFSPSNLWRSIGVGVKAPNMETAFGCGVGLTLTVTTFSKDDRRLWVGTCGGFFDSTDSSSDFCPLKTTAGIDCLKEPWRFKSISICSNPIGALVCCCNWLEPAERSVYGLTLGRGASAGLFLSPDKFASRLLSGPVGGREGLSILLGRSSVITFLYSSLSGVFTCGEILVDGEAPGGTGAGLFFLRDIGLGLSTLTELKSKI